MLCPLDWRSEVGEGSSEGTVKDASGWWANLGQQRCCGVLPGPHFLRPPTGLPADRSQQSPFQGLAWIEVSLPKPYPVPEAAAFNGWRKRHPKAQLRTSIKCRPSFRVPDGIHWDFCCKCSTDHLLPLPSTASLLPLQVLFLRTLPNKSPACKFPSQSLSP